MDERIEIWNVLHDGEITVVSEDGDTLTLFVSIPYLRRRLKPLGDSFVLVLEGLSWLSFVIRTARRLSLGKSSTSD
jgi:hypothetical protein